MSILRNGGLGVILIFGLSTSAFAENFNLLSDNRFLNVNIPGHPGGDQTPAAPFADVNASFSSSNSMNDYYTAVQNSSATPTQLICDTYITVQSTVPPGDVSSAGSYCAICFSVSSPVTADFTIDNFYVSGAGITYDGVIPTAGIQSDDPDLNTNYILNPDGYGSEDCVLAASGTQSNGSIELNFQPGYTYTFFEQMTGLGAYDPSGQNADPVSITWQANMNLTIVPEPSASTLFMAAGLTAFCRLRRSRHRAKQ